MMAQQQGGWGRDRMTGASGTNASAGKDSISEENFLNSRVYIYYRPWRLIKEQCLFMFSRSF
jgi:hypothetical protein